MKTFNRILSVLLVILMMVSIAMMGVVAEEATTVTTADEFAAALQAGGTVTLGGDIDFADYTGTYPITVAATTVVEGNNHTLKNVNVGTAGLLNLAACTSAANKATFKNLKIGTAGVPATAEVGANRGLIYDAAADYEKIYTVWNNVDVWASANIKGGYNFGVFFGTINGGHTFTGCDITLDLRDSTGSGNAVGAFIGRCNSGVGSLVFTNCSTNGYIVNGANVGGYIGKLDNAKAANFTFCVNNADVKNPGGGNGNAAGGFVGLSNDTPVLNYSDCVNNGIVVSPSGKAQTGHFHGTTTVQESATGKTYVPSNTETLTVDGVEYQTIHNSADLGTKLQTAGNHILMQHVDMSGVTAPAVVTDGILLEGYGMSLLGINAPNATDYGIFDLQKNYVSDCTGVTMRNFTVGSVTAPAISRNSVVVSYPTSKTYTDHNHDGNTDKEPVLTSTWENITVYGQLTTPNAHVGAFARYPGGIWTFNNVDVYLEVQTPGNVAVGGFFGRFDGTASFTDCTTNNLSSGVPLQNTGNNAGGFIGKCETGRTLTFTRCVNYANVQGGGSNGNGVGGFLGLNGGSSLTFTDCVNAGNIANANNAAVGAMVGSISSGKETVVSFFNAGTVTSGANKVTAPIEQVVYNGQTYSIDSADKTISVEDKVYTVLAVAKDLEKLANTGNFILFSDVRMGVVKASYDVADGVLLDGNNHSLTDLTLSTEVCLFTFKAGTTSTFMNLTVGSAEDPANAWAAVMTYAYTDEDVDLENNPNGPAQAEAAARRRASVGKVFNSTLSRYSPGLINPLSPSTFPFES